MARKMKIAIVGPKGSGKDTFANLLIEYGQIDTKLDYSHALKDVLSALFGWPRHRLDGLTVEDRTWREQPDEYWSSVLGRQVSPRWAMTYVGTEMVQQMLGRNLWPAIATTKANQLGRVAIVGCRYCRDLKWLHDHGYTIIGIYREPPSWLGEFYKEVDSLVAEDWSRTEAASIVGQRLGVHSSEYDFYLFKGYRAVINNSLSLEHLKTIARTLHERLS